MCYTVILYYYQLMQRDVPNHAEQEGRDARRGGGVFIGLDFLPAGLRLRVIVAYFAGRGDVLFLSGNRF